ncbi:MAG: hypothetical protein ACR2PL_14260 [Dehalococcoidia bacterium]
MSRTSFRFKGAPLALRSGKTRLDNLALVPASMLPYKEQWQRLANSLPAGSVLIVPSGACRGQNKILHRISRLFEAKGHPVTMINSDTITTSASSM